MLGSGAYRSGRSRPLAFALTSLAVPAGGRSPHRPGARLVRELGRSCSASRHSSGTRAAAASSRCSPRWHGTPGSIRRKHLWRSRPIEAARCPLHCRQHWPPPKHSHRATAVFPARGISGTIPKYNPGSRPLDGRVQRAPSSCGTSDRPRKSPAGSGPKPLARRRSSEATRGCEPRPARSAHRRTIRSSLRKAFRQEIGRCLEVALRRSRSMRPVGAMTPAGRMADRERQASPPTASIPVEMRRLDGPQRNPPDTPTVATATVGSMSIFAVP